MNYNSNPFNSYQEYKYRDYKPSKQVYEYKPYEPSFIGIYGERPRSKKDKPKRTVELKLEPERTVRQKKEIRTFQCYGNRNGPDIQASKMGPDYQVKDYGYKEYKPSQYDMKYKGWDKVKPYDGKIETYKGNTTGYVLTKENNPGMRHFRQEINETIMTKDRLIDENNNTPTQRPSSASHVRPVLAPIPAQRHAAPYQPLSPKTLTPALPPVRAPDKVALPPKTITPGPVYLAPLFASNDYLPDNRVLTPSPPPIYRRHETPRYSPSLHQLTPSPPPMIKPIPPVYMSSYVNNSPITYSPTDKSVTPEPPQLYRPIPLAAVPPGPSVIQNTPAPDSLRSTIIQEYSTPGQSPNAYYQTTPTYTPNPQTPSRMSPSSTVGAMAAVTAGTVAASNTSAAPLLQDQNSQLHSTAARAELNSGVNPLRAELSSGVDPVAEQESAVYQGAVNGSWKWQSRLPPEVVHCLEAYSDAHKGPADGANTVPTVQRTMHMIT